MTENEYVETAINDYWARTDKLLPEGFLAELEKRLENVFKNPTEECPVETSEFLSYLDLSFMQDYLIGFYKRPESIDYPPISILKADMFKRIRKIKYNTRLVSTLKAEPAIAKNLGFKKDKNGQYMIPDHRTIWHMFNVRLRNRGLDNIFELLVKNVTEIMERMGLVKKLRTVGDSMVIEALVNDEEAKYNAHYKVKGYKGDFVTELNEHIPLSKMTIGINDDESKCLIPHMERLKDDEIVPVSHNMDGGYDDLGNLAYLGIKGTIAVYKMHKGWVMRKDGEEKYVKKAYQKYHDHPDFKSGASLSYMLNFLYFQGKVRIVGGYFRNRNMSDYQENPEEYLAKCHQRNNGESFHSRLEQDFNLSANLTVKGEERVDRYVTMTLITVLGVALNRLQHGVPSQLISIAHLT